MKKLLFVCAALNLSLTAVNAEQPCEKTIADDFTIELKSLIYNISQQPEFFIRNKSGEYKNIYIDIQQKCSFPDLEWCTTFILYTGKINDIIDIYDSSQKTGSLKFKLKQGKTLHFRYVAYPKPEPPFYQKLNKESHIGTFRFAVGLSDKQCSVYSPEFEVIDK